MRNAFATAITNLAIKNKKIILLSGDIGNKLFDRFKEKCKNQFYNCGVAENNMVGVAAGLAKCGFIPYVYTITPFLVARSYEQIKLDVCYQNLNVKIVGTGAGLSYSRLGTTHHSLDDISLMKNIPEMNVVCPGDPIEVTELTKQISKIKKPFYLRLGKKGEPIINQKKNVKLFKINKIYDGHKICIISIGNTLNIGDNLRKELSKKRKEASLYSLHSVTNLNYNEISKILKKYSTLFLLEEHYFQGGTIKDILFDFNNILKNKKVIYQKIEKKFYTGLGEQNEAREFLKITATELLKKL
jgi:transketolase